MVDFEIFYLSSAAYEIIAVMRRLPLEDAMDQK
jgi:hypothetical protein